MRAPIVIKIGGAVLDNLTRFWDQIKAMDSPVVIVHGGGIQSTSLANRLGHAPKIIEGRRVTGPLDLKIAEWAMRGAVNVKLVAEANACGLKAVGLSGADGAMINVRRREPWLINGEKVDFGWVGEIVSIDTTLIETISDAGFISVIAPLGIDNSGQRYNVNADTVACTLAARIHAKVTGRSSTPAPNWLRPPTPTLPTARRGRPTWRHFGPSARSHAGSYSTNRCMKAKISRYTASPVERPLPRPWAAVGCASFATTGCSPEGARPARRWDCSWPLRGWPRCM